MVEVLLFAVLGLIETRLNQCWWWVDASETMFKKSRTLVISEPDPTYKVRCLHCSLLQTCLEFSLWEGGRAGSLTFLHFSVLIRRLLFTLSRTHQQCPNTLVSIYQTSGDGMSESRSPQDTHRRTASTAGRRRRFVGDNWTSCIRQTNRNVARFANYVRYHTPSRAHW